MSFDDVRGFPSAPPGSGLCALLLPVEREDAAGCSWRDMAIAMRSCSASSSSSSEIGMISTCELLGVDDGEGEERRFLRGLFDREMRLLSLFKKVRFSFSRSFSRAPVRR